MIEQRDTIRQFWIASGVSLVAALAFYFSTNATLHDLDYTNEIAAALLRGHIGVREKPPEWLNEMIPYGNRYYSAFPLGAVLSMLPIALLQKIGAIRDFPAHIMAALIAGGCVYFFYQLAAAFERKPNSSSAIPPLLLSPSRRILLALFPIFGTWTWCNLGFGGAWQIALGLALLGQAAALYFTLVRPSPFIAGTLFALAFGNRTELLITLPIYLYFFWRHAASQESVTGPELGPANPSPAPQLASKPGPTGRWKKFKRTFHQNKTTIVRFLIVPVVLAALTAIYNFARFHSIFDFGYFHIPEVRDEPWYKHGLFSVQAIPWNVYTMLFQGFENVSYFPYMLPNGFGCSIFLASPFLCLLFRPGGRYKAVAWVAIALITLVLWCHGNPGSWQFSYRYAMVLLPWMFLLVTGNGPGKITANELSLFAVSVAINAIAMWLFLWTEEIQPH